MWSKGPIFPPRQGSRLTPPARLVAGGVGLFLRRTARLFLFLWRGLGLLVVALLVATSTWQPLILGPPRQVESINPKIGVHTRLTDEVEPWKILRTLEMVREMGASWIVEYFPWWYYEPSPGRYSWEHPDMVINFAVHEGLTVIARLGFVPPWARPPDTTPSYLDPDHFDDFARYAAAFARRYRDRVRYIIVWNEPNLSLEWGYRPVDPAAYTDLLCRTYRAIKAVAPEVQVLGGALAPTLAPPGSEWGMNDLVFLQRMYDAGARECFDILAVHAYGWREPATAPPAADRINFRRTELLRAIMVRNGDAAKPVIITEGGWNDHPRWTKAVRPAQRVLYTLQAYDLVWREWDWALAFCPWVFRFPRAARSYQDYFTFVTVDFTPKPIYLAVGRYARGLLRPMVDDLLTLFEQEASRLP